jgi:hypothetical protein
MEKIATDLNTDPVLFSMLGRALDNGVEDRVLKER